MTPAGLHQSCLIPLIERGLIRFLYGRPLETLLATWGLSLVLQQAIRSLFGPTNPNRMYMFTGTSGLSVGNDGEQAVNNLDDGNWTADIARDNPAFPGYTWTTYSERLQQAGVSWQVYQEFDNYGDNSHPYFANFRNLDRSSPLYRRGRAIVPGSTADNAKASRGEHLIAAFERDVRSGNLPQVSWIVAPYLLSEHPQGTPAYGESLSARLLETLAASPEVWSKTVFLINYDENDGFFDHVPPALPATDPGMGASNVDVRGEDYHGVPVGLGPRVPMLVVSPWSRGGWVDSQVFDHTSVIRFLERRFGRGFGTPTAKDQRNRAVALGEAGGGPR